MRNAHVRVWAIIFFTSLACSPALARGCARTTNEQDRWVQQSVISLVRAARATYENDARQAQYGRVVKQIAREIDRCALHDSREFVGRYPQFFEYVRLLALGLSDDHELGFEVTDQEYFAQTSSFTAIPDFLLTQRFLHAVSRFENLSQAKALLREMNATRPPNDQLLFMSYTSRHLGTPDNPDSYRRLLIVVPGNAALHIPEKWVQFGIADPRRPRTVRNVSVVAVAPVASETANVYFKDYYRTYRRNGSITIKGRWELGEGDDNCASCHKSGVLPIFPVAGSVPREDASALEAINDRFLTYGTARFGRYLNENKFGPGLGPAANDVQLRRTDFRDDHTTSTTCSSCHHQEGLGALAWPMDRTLISSFVRGGQMPFGTKLSSTQRTKLYNGLIDDYFSTDPAHFGVLSAWLLGKSR